jgi:hypothetical protein
MSTPKRLAKIAGVLHMLVGIFGGLQRGSRLATPARSLFAALTAAAGAEAGADGPAFAAVVGQGVIRLRPAAGIPAPCDSSDNRTLGDDGPIRPHPMSVAAGPRSGGVDDPAVCLVRAAPLS